MAHTLKTEMHGALQKQAHTELFASQQYLAAACWFDARNFKGIAKYLRGESDSERTHAMAFIDFILTRGNQVEVMSLPKPDQSWSKALEVFDALVKAEEDVTSNINELMSMARDSKDYATEVFLHDFIKEQTDSIDKITSVRDKVAAYDAMPGLLYHLDAEL